MSVRCKEGSEAITCLIWREPVGPETHLDQVQKAGAPLRASCCFCPTPFLHTRLWYKILNHTPGQVLSWYPHAYTTAPARS